MDDTPEDIKMLVRQKLMSRSPEERFVMGTLMFDAAREIILASFPKNLSEQELKQRLFERIYRQPLPQF